MTKLQQLQQELFNLKARATTMLEDKNITAQELQSINNEIQTVKAKIKTAEEMENDRGDNGKKIDQTGKDITTANARYEKALFNSLSGKETADDIQILREMRAKLGSEAAADGGYLVPVDQQTQINELKRQASSLRELVTVEPVDTLSGSRVLEKDAEHVPFAAIGEGTKIEDTTSPQFTKVEFKVGKYGGILPIPNELLTDAGIRLKGYLNRWLAKKSVATENSLIITTLKTFTKKAITGIDDVKDILDKDLDPAISTMATVILNQDSFNYFNKLKDADGDYILEKDPKNPTGKVLSGRKIIVLSNRILKTEANKAPVIVGSLKEGVVLFDRQAISLLSTNIGGDSFVNDRTDVRAIMRMDVKKFDENALIYGEIDLATVGVQNASVGEN